MPTELIVSGSGNRWRQFITKCIFIPQRYMLALMGFFGLVNGYAMRLSLSVTITQMVQEPILLNYTNVVNEPICGFDDYNYIKRTEDQIEQSFYSDGVRYDWSQELQGIILSSFYWGYIITQLPAGVLAQRYGGKYVLTFGLFFSAICTMLTPICVQYNGVVGLIALRILMGIGEGVMYTALTVLLAAWVPINERTTICCFAFGGSMVGTIGGTYISAELLHKYNSWHPVFYFFGVMTILWCILFVLLCYDDPESHPFIKNDELDYLRLELGQKSMSQQKQAVPWRQMFTSVPFAAMILATFSQDWAFCVVVIDLPKYMNDVLHFSIQDNGIYSSIPQLMKLILSMFAGALSDCLTSNDKLTNTNARKIFIFVGSVVSGAFILAASYAECDRSLVVILFTISTAFQGVPGVTINPLDLSPNYAGILMGMAATIGAITGIIAPYIVGVITPHSLLTEWRLIFWITFILQLTKAFGFALWGSGDVQPWNNPDEIKPLCKPITARQTTSLYGSTVDGILPSAISYDSTDDYWSSNNNSRENINKNNLKTYLLE